ncbi:unnamed protein product, partial [Chrysoparadoxa australica]
ALSGRSIEDRIAGARGQVAPYKKNPMDFVLWKPSTDELPGWDSPWGRGRPGWHIECSAMADKLLWEDFKGKLSEEGRKHPHSFDIHGGGNDLTFPHHENEIAQSKCAHPEGGFANVWLHNEMLQVEGKKMSKSLGNFFTVRDLLEQGVPGEVIRFVMLSTHYRKPMDWTEKKRVEAEKMLGKWHRLIGNNSPGEVPPRVLSALADDLNTPLAISELQKAASQGDVQGLLAGLNLMGLRTINTEMLNLIREGEKERLDELAATLTGARIDAMETKDFSKVDRLKDALIDAGVEVRMSKAGVELVPGAGFDAAKLESLE